jgi:hypothetical protein
MYLIRKYKEAWAERATAREEFRRTNPTRTGRRYIPYPRELAEYPKFAEWLSREVTLAVNRSERVQIEVQDAARLPERKAMSFRSMWAHGMHIRIRTAEVNNVTSDCGIAATFERQDPEGEFGDVVNIEYVGTVEEILELDYRSHCCLVLVCDWVKAKYGGPAATIERDDYGFTRANFSTMIRMSADSFAFPIHCQQVFFSKDHQKPGWKVVCRVDVRGRRSELQFPRNDIELLAVGVDNDFLGLRSTQATPLQRQGSTPIAVREVLGQFVTTAHAANEGDSDYEEEEDLADWLD